MYSKRTNSVSDHQVSEARQARRTFGWKPVYDTSGVLPQRTVRNQSPTQGVSPVQKTPTRQEKNLGQRGQLSESSTQKRSSNSAAVPSLSPASSRQLGYQMKRDRRSPVTSSHISPRVTLSTPIQSRPSIRSDAASPVSVHSRALSQSSPITSHTRFASRSNATSPSPSVRSRSVLHPVASSPSPVQSRLASRSGGGSPSPAPHSRSAFSPSVPAVPSSLSAPSAPSPATSRMSTPRLVRHLQAASNPFCEAELVFPPAVPEELQQRLQSETVIELTEQPIRGSLSAATKSLDELQSVCSAAAVMRIHNPPTKLRNRIDELDVIVNNARKALEKAVRLRNE